MAPEHLRSVRPRDTDTGTGPLFGVSASFLTGGPLGAEVPP